MGAVGTWNPYHNDLLGLFGNVLAWLGLPAHSGPGLFVLAVAFFAGIPAVVAALGQHAWADDTERLVLCWRRDVSASLGNGLLVPLALIAANSCYRQTVEGTQSHLWSPILGKASALCAGDAWSIGCWVIALALTIAGIVRDDGHRHATQKVRYWDSPYTFRHFSNDAIPSWKVRVGWAVRMLSALVHFAAFVALLQVTSKVIAIDIDIINVVGPATDLSIFGPNINADYFGLGGIGQALFMSYIFEALAIASFVLMRVSDYETESLTRRRSAGQRTLTLVCGILYLAVTTWFSLLPLLKIHQLMKAHIDALIRARGTGTDNATIAAVVALKSISVWPVNTRVVTPVVGSLSSGVTGWVSKLLTDFLRKALGDGSQDGATPTAPDAGAAPTAKPGGHGRTHAANNGRGRRK
ncbi:MAG: hypothetical protein HZB16_22015 [Armatimonadetes bacterium]|nr:hypothetical protein [Armatimonadota bacterium]